MKSMQRLFFIFAFFCFSSMCFAVTPAAEFKLPERFHVLTRNEQYVGAKNLHGMAHGKGMMKGYGFYYEGDFYNGLPDGRGVMYSLVDDSGFASAITKGHFKEGELDGKVVTRWKNGGYFIGNYVAGKRSGKGKLFFPFYEDPSRGVLLKADFDGKELPTKGTLFFENKDVYTGQIDKSVPNGHGVYRSHTGIVYEGEFLHGDLYKGGKVKFPDGRVYEGELTLAGINGTGVMTFPSGQTYKGHFDGGEFSGKGKLVRPDGTVIDGEFWNGLAEGQVDIHYADGSHYVGAASQGKFAGQGKLVRSDGFEFEGPFYNGKPDGEGACKNGVKCVYRDGKLIK